ncbi:MAG TPA: AraC family transcriptional regulator [Verrucomicrobiaceae bacterium]|jgi:AraC-like DNA-binding protein
MKIGHLSETDIPGSRTRQWVVRADDSDQRGWIRGQPVCRALGQHRIAHLGMRQARAPYAIVRLKQSGTFFMACLKGEGRILVDGRWQACRAGMGCLLPPHMLHAFHAVKGRPWHFVWVRYQPEPEKRPIVRVGSPVMTAFDGGPLQASVMGLHAECLGAPSPAAVHHWLELIQGYVLRFAQPWQMDARLARLWERVAARPDAEWSLEDLAQQAHMSGEHLRRLSVQQLGRTPMRQVTYLRMRHACELLSSTEEKIATVARRVGYRNPFVFSTTFKKWIGWRPSGHRRGGGRGILTPSK